MKWIKEVVLDIAITILIILAVTTEMPWLRMFIIAYTVIMVVLKIIAFSSSSFSPILRGRQRPTAPVWFIHLLYAVNVAFLLVFKWWIVAGLWVLIWIFSWLTERKTASSKTRAGKKKSQASPKK